MIGGERNSRNLDANTRKRLDGNERKGERKQARLGGGWEKNNTSGTGRRVITREQNRRETKNKRKRGKLNTNKRKREKLNKEEGKTKGIGNERKGKNSRKYDTTKGKKPGTNNRR